MAQPLSYAQAQPDHCNKSLFLSLRNEDINRTPTPYDDREV